MARLNKVEISPGIVWIEVPELDLRVLCGCPADSVKHLMRRGMIRWVEAGGIRFETGPNAILLSDVMIQNGAFCNLAEFPVLQMFYRQGMLLPGHPNNTGRRPLLIGRRAQLEAQMQYIYRGNYGLISAEEMMAAGASPQLAYDLMRLKLRFAFGSIQHPRQLLESKILDDGPPTEIAPGVTLRRLGLNRFQFSFADEIAEVDLNLPPYEVHECPYPLGAFQFRREFFSVIHSGEGDGWDIRRPSMGAIIVFMGRIYLVDAGPNLVYTLGALGIGINEVEGIFHTHSHDDHFAGLTSLMQGDHRIKYFAAPLVRAAVTKKLAALLAFEEEEFEEYFDVHDLELDRWNDVAGLEVMPSLSPHPVETTIFTFRTMAADGYRSYAHCADIIGIDLLRGMIVASPEAPGLSQDMFDAVVSRYRQPADVKKVDVGGGMIHGNAADFRDDASRKIILAHTAQPLTAEQKRIGSGASFGTVEVLVHSPRDFVWRSAFQYMSAYLPSVPADHLGILLNGPVLTFNPETILLKEGQTHASIYLLLTGQVELLDGESDFRATLSAGALLGEMTGLHGLPPPETYRAASFVQVLEIPCSLYLAFVERHALFAQISRLLELREFLRKTWLFGGIMSTSTLNAIAEDMSRLRLTAGDAALGVERMVCMVKSGRLARMIGSQEVEELGPGDFFGEETAVFEAPALASLTAKTDCELILVSARLLRNIPNVRWKLFETFGRRNRRDAVHNSSSRAFLAWRDAYSVDILRIDNQHRRLFDIANKLLAAVSEGRGRDEVVKALDFLLDYTMYHFAEEEALQDRYGYSETAVHKARHKRLMAQVHELEDRLHGPDSVGGPELLDFLNGWIVNHILIEDRKYAAFLNSKGVY